MQPSNTSTPLHTNISISRLRHLTQDDVPSLKALTSLFSLSLIAPLAPDHHHHHAHHHHFHAPPQQHPHHHHHAGGAGAGAGGAGGGGLNGGGGGGGPNGGGGLAPGFAPPVPLWALDAAVRDLPYCDLELEAEAAWADLERRAAVQQQQQAQQQAQQAAGA